MGGVGLYLRPLLTLVLDDVGTAETMCLRFCATNRKVAGSIPASVRGFFIVVKSFRSHSASNRNEYQEHFLGIKAAGASGWQPSHHRVLLSWNLGTLTSWNPMGHSKSVKGLLYPYWMTCVIGFAPRLVYHPQKSLKYTLKRRLHGPQSWSGSFAEEIQLLSLSGMGTQFLRLTAFCLVSQRILWRRSEARRTFNLKGI